MSSRQKRWESVEKASIPIETLVDRYLSACCSAAMSPKTIRGYHEKLKRYVRTMGGTLVDFTLEAVRQHLASLQRAEKWEGHPHTPSTGEKLSATTIRNHGRVLASFASWLEIEGYTDCNVLHGLKIPKANDISLEPLSEDEICRLMHCFNLNTEIGCRNAAMVWLFLDTGLRCAELVGLEMELDGHTGVAKLKSFVALTRQGMGVTEASRMLGISPEYACRKLKRGLVELLAEKMQLKLR